jgi:hypothetical protein
MKRAPGKLKAIWPSQVAGMEVWSSEWLDAPKPRCSRCGHEVDRQKVVRG